MQNLNFVIEKLLDTSHTTKEQLEMEILKQGLQKIVDDSQVEVEELPNKHYKVIFNFLKKTLTKKEIDCKKLKIDEIEWHSENSVISLYNYKLRNCILNRNAKRVNIEHSLLERCQLQTATKCEIGVAEIVDCVIKSYDLISFSYGIDQVKKCKLDTPYVYINLPSLVRRSSFYDIETYADITFTLPYELMDQMKESFNKKLLTTEEIKSMLRGIVSFKNDELPRHMSFIDNDDEGFALYREHQRQVYSVNKY